jgi:hypothetical protein
MMAAYPEYILKKVRQRQDLEQDDKSMDDKLNNMSPNNIFRNVCNWEGLIHMDEQIKYWILDIYGVDLDEVSDNK